MRHLIILALLISFNPAETKHTSSYKNGTIKITMEDNPYRIKHYNNIVSIGNHTDLYYFNKNGTVRARKINYISSGVGLLTIYVNYIIYTVYFRNDKNDMIIVEKSFKNRTEKLSEDEILNIVSQYNLTYEKIIKAKTDKFKNTRLVHYSFISSNTVFKSIEFSYEDGAQAHVMIDNNLTINKNKSEYYYYRDIGQMMDVDYVNRRFTEKQLDEIRYEFNLK